jgi:hypothetical protein
VLQPPLDVSRLEIGPPTVIAELDVGKMKGELRRLAWAPDGKVLYVQTAEGTPPLERLRHFTIALAGGTVTSVEQEPDWAVTYWAWKQERVAPGMPSLAIEVEQTQQKIKGGPGAAGVLDRTSNPAAVAASGPSPESLANAQHGDQSANVVRLTLLGEEIASWVNERVIPGLRFGWGPAGSGAIAYVASNGGLLLFDGEKRRQEVADTRHTILPAWSGDGCRLAYLEKQGRKKYVLQFRTLAPNARQLPP